MASHLGTSIGGNQPQDAKSFLVAAEALANQIRGVARNAELQRKPDDDVITAARTAGLFGLMAPRCYGGAQLDLDTYFDVVVTLGEADASHAWVLAFYIEHIWMFCQFPEPFQRSLFADGPDVLAPAMLSPTGAATPEPGGLRLSGRWSWATGIMHADWVIAGAIVRGDRPRAVFCALPRDEVSVDDTWHMDGMCATGSNDVLIADRFVPNERVVDIGAMMAASAIGATLHDGPLFRTPMAPILSFAASLPALGQAKAAVRTFAEQLPTRIDFFGTSQADRVDRQVLLATADLDVRAAELLMRGVLSEVMEQRNTADEPTRVRWTATITHAVTLARSAVDRLADASGASAHKLDNPIQRARRDLNTMACHTVFDPYARLRSHGRTLLDLPSESRWH